MKGFILSRRAARDLREITGHIALDSEDASERFENDILHAIRLLVSFPLMGHTREDLTSRAVRSWPVGSYLIIYRPKTQPLQVVRILHGARDVSRLL